jgi:hypothetical protein
MADVFQASAVVLPDETEVQVSIVVIDRSSARYATQHVQTVSGHKGQINFFKDVLVAADDNGRLVYVHHKICSVRVEVAQGALFYSQVDVRIGRIVVVNLKNHCMQSSVKRV